MSDENIYSGDERSSVSITPPPANAAQSVVRPTFDPENNPLHVVCENPLDFRPALTATLNEIQRIIDNDLQDGQKLIVNVGEAHNLPIHKGFQTALINGIKQKITPEFLVALEIAHDGYPAHIHPAVYSNANNFSPLSPYGTAFQYDFLGTDKIRTIFHDMAVMQDGGIDLSDTATNDFISVHFPKLVGQSLHGKQPGGMAVRNFFMAEKIWEQPENIIVQLTGLSHVLGDKRQNLPSETSLASAINDMAEQKGHPPPYILNIMPLSEGGLDLTDIPEAAHRHFSDTVIIEGLDTTSSVIEDYDSAGRLEIDREQSHLMKIWEASGASDNLLPKPDISFEEMRRNAERAVKQQEDLKVLRFARQVIC